MDASERIARDPASIRMQSDCVLTNFSPGISISLGSPSGSGTMARMRGGFRRTERGMAGCFDEIGPPNDFESTRLVGRIIQFEYACVPWNQPRKSTGCDVLSRCADDLRAAFGYRWPCNTRRRSRERRYVSAWNLHRSRANSRAFSLRASRYRCPATGGCRRRSPGDWLRIYLALERVSTVL